MATSLSLRGRRGPGVTFTSFWRVRSWELNHGWADGAGVGMMSVLRGGLERTQGICIAEPLAPRLSDAGRPRVPSGAGPALSERGPLWACPETAQQCSVLSYRPVCSSVLCFLESVKFGRRTRCAAFSRVVFIWWPCSVCTMTCGRLSTASWAAPAQAVTSTPLRVLQGHVRAPIYTWVAAWKDVYVLNQQWVPFLNYLDC